MNQLEWPPQTRAGVLDRRGQVFAPPIGACYAVKNFICEDHFGEARWPFVLWRGWGSALRQPLIALLLLAVGWTSAATACDTPVYRFAMYSDTWTPWPYRVFYLHSGADGAAGAAADAAVNERLQELALAEPQLTNIALEKVDASAENAFESLPPMLKEAWEARKEKTQPLHVVLTPRYATLFAGRLDVKTLEAMIESPLRKRLNEQLSHGKIVFVLLEGTDPTANKAAEDTIRGVAKQAASGKLSLDPSGAESLLPPLADGAEAAKPKDNTARVEVEHIRVSPSDPQEQWFVKMLMAVEPDLHEFAGQPMVFGSYGRGRVLEPFIGKGVTTQNLIYEQGLLFMLGPCSCEVKEQNPGADLLTTHDWMAAAVSMAQKFGEEEGNQNLLGVGALIPTLGGARTPGSQEPRELVLADNQATANTTAPAAPAPGVTTPNVTTPGAAPSNPTTSHLTTPNSSNVTTAAGSNSTVASSNGGAGFGSRMARNLGIGVGVILILLIAGSLTFMRFGG